MAVLFVHGSTPQGFVAYWILDINVVGRLFFAREISIFSVSTEHTRNRSENRALDQSQTQIAFRRVFTFWEDSLLL
jgi:hypothetical protein